MTEFTEWRSLVDGEVISVIPDGLVDNYNADDDDPAGVYNGASLSDFYAGDLGDFSRVAAGIIGESALESTGDSAGIGSEPDDELDDLPNYIPAGNNFRFYSQDRGGLPMMIMVADKTSFEGSGSYSGISISPWFDAGELRIRDDDGNDVATDSWTGSNASDWHLTEVETSYDSGADDLTINAESFEVDQSDGTKQDSVASVSATVTPPRTEGGFITAQGTSDTDGIRFDGINLNE